MKKTNSARYKNKIEKKEKKKKVEKLEYLCPYIHPVM